MERVAASWAVAGTLFLGILGFGGCIRLKPAVLEQPKAILGSMIFCSSVEQKEGWAKPSAEQTAFSRDSDSSVYAFLGFRDLRGTHTLLWKWFDPGRKLYRATEPIALGEESKAFESYFAWDRIFASEDKRSGTWTVAVFLDNKLLAVKSFEIK
jgi:hypothetical protein